MTKESMLSNALDSARGFLSENGLDSLPHWLCRNPSDFEIIYNYPLANDVPIIRGDAPVQNFRSGSPSGVYIHIPFCYGTCSYCHYTRKRLQNTNQIDAFLELIAKEMCLWTSLLPPDFGKRVETVFIGGGTPTTMTPLQISRVAELLTKTLHIYNAGCLREYTWEASPESIIGESFEKLQVLRDIGVNRLSIGIQTFEERLLMLCAREHTTQQAIDAVQCAKNAGFGNLNLDLIYALPTQTYEEWFRTLNVATELRPQSISIHQLRLKSGTPMYDSHCHDLLDEPARLTMLAMAHVSLKAAGYMAIDNDCFILAEKFDHYHQKDKWTRCKDLLGLGPAAYGYLKGTTYFNLLRETDYAASVERMRLPIWREKKLTIAECKARALVMGLSFYEGASMQLYETMFHESVDVCFGTTLSRLEADGLIERAQGHVRLTIKGGFFSPEVRREFFVNKQPQLSRGQGSYFPDFAYETLPI